MRLGIGMVCGGGVRLCVCGDGVWCVCVCGGGGGEDVVHGLI